MKPAGICRPVHSALSVGDDQIDAGSDLIGAFGGVDNKLFNLTEPDTEDSSSRAWRIKLTRALTTTPKPPSPTGQFFACLAEKDCREIQSGHKDQRPFIRKTSGLCATYFLITSRCDDDFHLQARISTFRSARASRASPHAREGAAPFGTHMSHTVFISVKSVMSDSQTIACKMRSGGGTGTSK